MPLPRTTITASQLHRGDVICKIRSVETLAEVHEIHWLSKETAEQIGGQIKVRTSTICPDVDGALRDKEDELLFSKDDPLDVEPYFDPDCHRDCLTEYVVVFAWREANDTAYGKKTDRRKICSVLATDRDAAESLARAKLKLTPMFDGTTDRSGWDHESTQRYDVDAPIVLEIYKPKPGDIESGLIVFSRYRRIGEVFEDLAEALRKNDMIDEYMSGCEAWSATGGLTMASPWPADVRWICAYPVTGGSEGHYVHIGVILDGEERKAEGGQWIYGPRKEIALFLVKTFQGWSHACAIANAAARLLGA